ncbi:serine hydrolase [Aurantiacibacter gilvus]|uniref:Serine hydrolase n=1 Tax=Aurantiacibacter gilvus TaxID=3139141 RepID=A0ABU9ICV8_9SPHN
MKRFLIICLAPVLALGLQGSPLRAQSAEDVERLEHRAEDIVAAMGGEAVYGEVFTDQFVEAVPATQFTAIQGQIESQFGPLIGVDSVEAVTPNGANIAIRFERGLASGQFTLENGEPYEVTGFLLTDVRPIGDSVEQLLADIATLPGETGVLVTSLVSGIEPVAASNADQQFAIGSTFKLYVLSALAHSIAAGERNWDDVVHLSERSYPGGQLQNWPLGSPVTLHTLATLMISNSDNTATDQLIAVLGREAVEAELVAASHSDPSATLPFLTTREMFVLKSTTSVDPGEYLAADLDWRRDALDSLGDVEPEMADVMAAFTGGPNLIDIEWFASPTDIARLLQRLAALEDDTALGVLAVNPSMSDSMQGAWDYAGYKGGSEPGVLNLTWLLRDDASGWQVVTLSWNNPEEVLDNARLEMLGMRAIALASAPAAD